jgi:4,5-DOPA dioxygenase extradiol
MNLQNLKNITDSFENSSQMPVLFVGHGNPMNALADNAFTRKLTNWGISFAEKPKAILMISAHWQTKGTHVMISAKPRTIHDFGGFPEQLYKVQYLAPGSPGFAREAKQLITSTSVMEDDQWGLDHGTWTVLKHMFPMADIPVFQLSIDFTKPPQYHYNLAQELRTLRKKGVLIIGSGNIVHNLYQIEFDENAKPYDWAIEFDETVKSKLQAKEYESLINYPLLGRTASLSVPSNDHYLPMLYSLGLTDKKEMLAFTYEEIQNASISMRCFQIG